jgi:hypothetical protein
VRIELSALARLDEVDRGLLEPAFTTAADQSRRDGRAALAGVFEALARAVHVPTRRTSVRLETVADLDDDDLLSLIEGTSIQRDRERAADCPSREAFFEQLRLGLEAERQRRSSVLTAIDAAMDWYDRRFPDS